MHPGQADLTLGTITGLIATQFPHWRDRPITPIVSHGTVNTLHRLGDDLVLRFPLLPVTDPAALIREQQHARTLQPHVPVTLPEPVALGSPGEGYAGYWTAWRWIDGDTAEPHTVPPTDLARFVRSLQVIDTGGQAPENHPRGKPLHQQDDWVRHCFTQSHDLTDVPALEHIWDACLATEPPEQHTWVHADLMPGNLLVRDNRLTAVIDLGAVGIGDPALDLMPAWNLFDAGERAAFRHTLDVDDTTWQRGRGWALVQAIGALWYYRRTNPPMAATSTVTLTALLSETIDQPPGR